MIACRAGCSLSIDELSGADSLDGKHALATANCRRKDQAPKVVSSRKTPNNLTKVLLMTDARIMNDFD
jgi:hypothetical protein